MGSKIDTAVGISKKTNNNLKPKYITYAFMQTKNFIIVLKINYYL